MPTAFEGFKQSGNIIPVKDTIAQNGVIANTKLIKDSLGWSGKNKGQWINKSLGGDATSGYKLDNGGSSLIAKVKQNTSYTVSRKHGQGNRFRIIGFVNEPSSVASLSSEQLYSNNSADTYTVNSGSYNYFVFTYDSTTTISQDTAEAMIRDADILDSTYEPYFGSTAFPRSEQAVLGAKNILPITNETDTIKGVTFTVNKNARGDIISVTINGTNDGTGNSDFPLIKGGNRVNPELLGYEIGKQYIMSGCNGGSNSTYMLMFNGSVANRFKCTDGAVTDVFVSGDLVYPEIRVVEGASVSNVDLYPMLRLATDPDDTYVPYAMTNRELTDKVQGILPDNCKIHRYSYSNDTTPKKFSVGSTPLLIIGKHNGGSNISVFFVVANTDVIATIADVGNKFTLTKDANNVFTITSSEAYWSLVFIGDTIPIVTNAS